MGDAVPNITENDWFVATIAETGTNHSVHREWGQGGDHQSASTVFRVREHTIRAYILVLFCQQFTTDSDLFSTTHSTWQELRLASDNSVCMQMIGVLTVVSRSRWLLPVPDEQLFAFPQDDASLRQLYPSTTHTHTHTHNTYTHTQTYRHRHTYTHTCTKKIYKRVSLPRSGIDDCLTQQGNWQPTSIPHWAP